jgi:hypothetical protein
LHQRSGQSIRKEIQKNSSLRVEQFWQLKQYQLRRDPGFWRPWSFSATVFCRTCWKVHETDAVTSNTKVTMRRRQKNRKGSCVRLSKRIKTFGKFPGLHHSKVCYDQSTIRMTCYD